MFSRLFGRLFGFGLSADEDKKANEAKERTLRLLRDALKKKKSLLVEDPKEFGDQKMKYNLCRLITTDLVKELIRELEKVTFAKNTNPKNDTTTIAYVYPGSRDRTIYLCAPFWKDPESRSRQDTIIHEVSHFLGYGHTVEENSDGVKKSPQSMLCPLTAYSVAFAFSFFMDHPESYRNGSYPCCGETSRDTVCEKSRMAKNLRSLRAGKDEEEDFTFEFIFLLFLNKLKKDKKDDLDFVIKYFLPVESIHTLDLMSDLLMIMKRNVLGTSLTPSRLDKEPEHKEQ